jgi:hypothetical protein
VRRFADRHKFAAANGTAPIPASSGRIQRHRLNRGGNRRLNLVARRQRRPALVARARLPHASSRTSPSRVAHPGQSVLSSVGASGRPSGPGGSRTASILPRPYLRPAPATPGAWPASARRAEPTHWPS